MGGAQQLVFSLSVSAYVALTDAVGCTGAFAANKSHTRVVNISTTISLFHNSVNVSLGSIEMESTGNSTCSTHF